jgi:acyl-CoA thioester hydrolase
MLDTLKSLTLSQLEQLPLSNRATVTDGHLDLMGHMNVRHYVGFFDDATWHLFAGIGMDHQYYTTSGNGSFALQQFIFYLAEVRADETVAIRSRFHGRTDKRFHFTHFMINETTGKLAATSEMLGSHANLTARRTAPFPPHIAANFDALLAKHNQLDWPSPLCGAIHL